jgi:ABC-2 type transport system ATP-binding protein/lipopolysaccharide transport system ATP-binding protein
LLQILAGVLKPTEGEVTVRGRVAPIIELGVGFHPDLTGEENVYLNASLYGLTNKEIRERYADIVEFSGLGSFIDVPVRT